MREMSKQAEEFKTVPHCHAERGNVANGACRQAVLEAPNRLWPEGIRGNGRHAGSRYGCFRAKRRHGPFRHPCRRAGGKDSVSRQQGESLVLAGPLVREICATSHAPQSCRLIPNIMRFFNVLRDAVKISKNIIITASGGPFTKKDGRSGQKSRQKTPSPTQHWKMGQKISIDSSTMMNKALELIEAVQLFGVDKGED